MKKMNFFFLKKTMFTYVMLTGVFILCSLIAEAQTFASAKGTANPQAELAEKLNVIAYPLGTFDPQVVITKLDALEISMRGINNPSLLVRMKQGYVNNILRDVNAWSIATEISLVKSLAEVKSEVGGSPGQLVNLYNEIVGIID